MVMDIAEEFSRNVQPVWATWGTVSVFLDLDRKHDVSKQDGVCSEFDWLYDERGKETELCRDLNLSTVQVRVKIGKGA